jgi:hypothetical protein
VPDKSLKLYNFSIVPAKDKLNAEANKEQRELQENRFRLRGQETI